MTDQYKPTPICNDCDLPIMGDALYWIAAFNSWHERCDNSYIVDGLRLNRPIPPWARDFIADMIMGKIKRKPILKKAAIDTRNRFIKNGYRDLLAQCQQAKKKGRITCRITPQDLAIKELCAIYGLKENQVKRIISRKNYRA